MTNILLYFAFLFISFQTLGKGLSDTINFEVNTSKLHIKKVKSIINYRQNRSYSYSSNPSMYSHIDSLIVSDNKFYLRVFKKGKLVIEGMIQNEDFTGKTITYRKNGQIKYIDSLTIDHNFQNFSVSEPPYIYQSLKFRRNKSKKIQSGFYSIEDKTYRMYIKHRRNGKQKIKQKTLCT